MCGWWRPAPIDPKIQSATQVRLRSERLRKNGLSRTSVPVSTDRIPSSSHFHGVRVSSLLWKWAYAHVFHSPHKWPHFSSSRTRNGESSRGLESSLRRKLRYLQHFLNIYIYIPSLTQAKHTLTCKRRKGKSLQEIANGFQVFPLLIFTDSGFLLGKRMSFLNVPDLGLPSYKHLFREVLCCYLFSTNNWSRSIPEAWWHRHCCSLPYFSCPWLTVNCHKTSILG